MVQRTYSEAEKDKINKSMYSLGIQTEAQSTTLRKEGQEVLHELIVSREQADYNAIIFYPDNSVADNAFNANITSCDLLYQLYIKENFLSNHYMFRLGLLDLHRALNEEGTYVRNTAEMPTKDRTYNRKVVLALEDLYYGQDCAMTSGDYLKNAAIERYLTHRMYQYNDLLVIQSSCHPRNFGDYWSKRFSAMLSATAKIIKVSAP